MLKTKLWTALPGAVLLCGLAFAQAPAMPPEPPSASDMAAHQVSRLTQRLSLTSDQQTKATEIFANAANSAESNRTNMRSAHDALIKAIEANNSGAITAAAQQIGNLTAEQIEAHANAQAAFYAILNADQKTKYQTMLMRGPHGFGPHAPGAAPPPPPPPLE